MDMPHISSRGQSLLRGLAVAAVVVTAGVLVGAAPAPSAAILVAAKVATAVGARYAARQLVDGAPDGALMSHLRSLPLASRVMGKAHRELAVETDATILEALGDFGPAITFG